MTMQNLRFTIGGVVLATAALALANPVAAIAATTSSYSVNPMWVEPGETIDITLSPATDGLLDFCFASDYDSTSANTDPGFSVVAYILGPGGYQVVLGRQPNDQGQGSFNPSTQTSPYTVTMTVPSSVVDGTYTLSVQCIGPLVDGRFYYPWNTAIAGDSDIAFFEVESSSVPPTDPASDAEAVGALAATGVNGSAYLWLVVAIALIALGAGRAVWRRRIA